MKQDKDWTKAVGDRLRDAESSLPEGGWERLAGEMSGSVSSKRLWSFRWPRYVAAAAVLLVCIAVGDAFRRASRHAGVEVPREVAAIEAADGVRSVVEPVVAQAVVASKIPVESLPKKIMTTTQVDSLDPSPAPEALSEHAVPQAIGTEVSGGDEPMSDAAASKSSTHSARARSIDADPFAEPQSSERGGLVFGAKAGGALAFANKGSATRPLAMLDNSLDNKGVNQMQINFANCTYAHKQPLSFAVTFGREFAHGLSLESGVVYTLLRSEVSVPLGSGSVSQSLHLIGIPVRVNWAWLKRGGFSLYLGAGAVAEKCIAARFGEQKIQEKAVQFSAFAAVGAQYRLGKHVGLYFEPEVSYYFTETTLRTSRTERPVSFSLQLGVRFTY